MQSSNIIQCPTVQSSSSFAECYTVWPSAAGSLLIRYDLRSLDRVFNYLVKTIEVANGFRCNFRAHGGCLPGILREEFAQLAALIFSRSVGTWSRFKMSSYLLVVLPADYLTGFQFPGCFIALLAVSEQAEQAVVTSTLILWRSLGIVLGISLSSLIVQNALVVYLDEMVTGPDKYKVIMQSSLGRVTDLLCRSYLRSGARSKRFQVSHHIIVLKLWMLMQLLCESPSSQQRFWPFWQQPSSYR